MLRTRGGGIIWLHIQWHVLSPTSLTAITHIVLILLSADVGS